MNNVTKCAKCAIYNGEGCNLSPKLYATRQNDLACPYFLTREDAPQTCQQCEMLADALDTALNTEGLMSARLVLKKYRGES